MYYCGNLTALKCGLPGLPNCWPANQLRLLLLPSLVTVKTILTQIYDHRTSSHLPSTVRADNYCRFCESSQSEKLANQESGCSQSQMLSQKDNNLTVVTEFFLLGFQVSHGFRIFLFYLFLVIYCVTICGNLQIIALVSTSKNLHTPMYFFISQLSISDILVITDIVPKMLDILLNNGGTITVVGCITQFYFFASAVTLECFLLTVMSYDRYVAICYALNYISIMTRGYCGKLVVLCWVFGFLIILVYIVAMAELNFCGPNTINHLFCDILRILDLACNDTFIIHLEIYLLCIPTVLIPTAIIIMSYTYIVSAVLRIQSKAGRKKAFSTCSSHLTVVSIYYWTMFSVYVVPPKGLTLSMSKALSLLYTVFTPLVNPMIYSLRNKDIGKAVQETLYKLMIW
ncbi:olfactory receptor 5G9-like [Anomaloglossus baeobatrachus]